MDLDNLLGTLVQGALRGRKKRKRGALRYLTGRGGSLINPSTVLGAAGLVWGLYEAVKGQTAGGVANAPLPPAPGAPVPPPLPVASAGAPVSADVLRLVRLTVAAATADGALSDTERGVLMDHARAVGAEALVEREIAGPRPLAEIAGGVADPRLREQMYALAFGIVRADEAVSGTERIFLAQLAHHLTLDAPTTQRLESEATAGIEHAARESETE